MYDEIALVESIRAGDTNAFEVVVERYQGRIGRYLRRVLANQPLAEDLTQETFINAYVSIRKTNSPLTLGPWLYRIATNLARMHFRRQRILRFLPFRREAGGHTAPAADAGLDERDEVRRALAKLPQDYAICLLLHMVEGFKHHEVGAILGISAEAARKRTARGSEMFRKAYGSQEVAQR